ncbi:MAG: pyridoxal phosphate-dependent [Verrucomicrobia bacterium]|nr:MAG: pyridoxal phosphate-dependent [Verrucomicrobiota bacterium]
MLYPELTGLDDTETPALLFSVERIKANIQLMIQMVAGDPSRLRPHVKTHKTPEIIALQVSKEITRFKAATLSETELCAREEAVQLDRKLHHSPSVNVRGLHAYNGHLCHKDLSARGRQYTP